MAASQSRIREQALSLFLERGFDQVTIAEIAAAANVGERTVYRHFPTKESFILGSMPGTFDRLLAEIAQAPSELSATDAVIHALSKSADQRKDLEDERSRMTLLRRHPAVQQAWLVELHRLEIGLTQWLTTRASRPEDDLRCRTAAAAIVASHRIASERWDGTDMTSYLDELITALEFFGDRINTLAH